jgi:hypothetical protein
MLSLVDFKRTTQTPAFEIMLILAVLEIIE